MLTNQYLLCSDDAEWDPDGPTAGKEYRKAIRNIIRCLRELEMIWEDQIEFCNRCTKSLKDEANAADIMVEAFDFSTNWVIHQEDILKSRLDIGKVCDAIPIKATGSPFYTSPDHQRETHRSREDSQELSCPLDPISSLTTVVGWIGSGVGGMLNQARYGFQGPGARPDHEETPLLDSEISYDTHTSRRVNHSDPTRRSRYEDTYRPRSSTYE
jgi:hypothetical protein